MKVQKCSRLTEVGIGKNLVLGHTYRSDLIFLLLHKNSMSIEKDCGVMVLVWT